MNSPAPHNEVLLTEARLSSPPAKSLIKYHEVPALKHELKHFKEFNDVDLAHTVMLKEQGILSHDVATTILRGLLDLRAIAPKDFSIDPSKGSFLLQVEAFLSSKMGEDIGGQMHTGRSRIDQGTTVRRMYACKRLLDVLENVNKFRTEILALAEEHSRSIMPGYTHMQQAQPWVFGHYLLSIATRLTDDYSRLTESYARTNLNPLGAVGLSGTSWPLNRERTTELLGFSATLDNSKLGREAFYAAEVVGDLSMLMATLNDLATDLHIWSTTEFGFVESADAYCGTSSIFPQKKNPIGLETIKKAAGGSVTWLTEALATFRSEGTGDQAMRELEFMDDALDTTEGMLELFAGIASTLIVHKDAMRLALSGSWCASSNLADVIVRETGLSFRQVHHLVARLVRICMIDKILPAELTGEVVNRAALETIGKELNVEISTLKDALDPDSFVTTRVTSGSVAPNEVDRMLGIAKHQLSKDREWLASKRTYADQASTKLTTAINTILCQPISTHLLDTK